MKFSKKFILLIILSLTVNTLAFARSIAMVETRSMCDSPGVGEMSKEYHRIPIILNGPPKKGGYKGMHTWNSEKNLGDTSILQTSSKLFIRINLKPMIDIKNFNYCKFISPYDIINLTVEVSDKIDKKAKEVYTFNKIPLNGCSQIKSFRAPASANPVIKISNAQSNYVCKCDGGKKCPPGRPVFKCVSADTPHPAGGCFNIELHVETDSTKSIPE